MSIIDLLKLHWMIVERADCVSPYICFNDGDGDGDGGGGDGDDGDDDGAADGAADGGDDDGGDDDGDDDAAEAAAAAEADDPEAAYEFDIAPPDAPTGAPGYGAMAGASPEDVAAAADAMAGQAGPEPGPGTPEVPGTLELPEVVVEGPTNQGTAQSGQSGQETSPDAPTGFGGFGGFGSGFGLGGLGSALGSAFDMSASAAGLPPADVYVGGAAPDLSKAQDRPATPPREMPAYNPQTQTLELPQINVTAPVSRGREAGLPGQVSSPAVASPGPFGAYGLGYDPNEFGGIGGRGAASIGTMAPGPAQTPGSAAAMQAAFAPAAAPAMAPDPSPFSIPGVPARSVQTQSIAAPRASARDKSQSPPATFAGRFAVAPQINTFPARFNSVYEPTLGRAAGLQDIPEPAPHFQGPMQSNLGRDAGLFDIQEPAPEPAAPVVDFPFESPAAAREDEPPDFPAENPSSAPTGTSFDSRGGFDPGAFDPGVPGPGAPQGPEAPTPDFPFESPSATDVLDTGGGGDAGAEGTGGTGGGGDAGPNEDAAPGPEVPGPQYGTTPGPAQEPVGLPPGPDTGPPELAPPDFGDVPFQPGMPAPLVAGRSDERRRSQRDAIAEELLRRQLMGLV